MMPLYIAVVLLSYIISIKAYARLKLSRAKHPSLRGHSKWSRRVAKWIPFFSYEDEHFFSSDDAHGLNHLNEYFVEYQALATR